MSIIAYSQQDEFKLVQGKQDCMGWKVVDQAGNKIGEVTEMLIETDDMMVDSIMINDKVRVSSEDIELRDGRVIIRGILHEKDYAETQLAAKPAAQTSEYRPLPRNQKSANVAGITREAVDNEITLPVVEEKLVIGKRVVDKGEVNVRTTVVEQPVEESVNLRRETLKVERRKVDLPIDDESKAFKEGTFEIRTQAEVPVISKEARVVEEVLIGKEVSERSETVRETVKRTDVEVEDLPK